MKSEEYIEDSTAPGSDSEEDEVVAGPTGAGSVVELAELLVGF